jgi:2-desacetyl-2-hydroxyethyl bacteriochlorophyllide A dehydrogenase
MIAETMQAVVAYGPHDYRVETRPVPRPGAGEVLVRVSAGGICASDMKCFHGGALFWGRDGSGGYCEAPVIPGHESAGYVVALGEGATERHGVQLGQHVVAEQIIPCNACRFCKSGHYWMCQKHDIFGFKRGRAEGGMAEYMVLPANSRIHVLDERLTPRQAAYLEPLACAIHAVQRGQIQPGDTVVVAGVGNIGLCMLQAARRYNPGRLIALDTKPYRLDLAARLGADVTLNPAREDAIGAVRDLTGGYGADVYIEAAGHPSAAQQGLEILRRLGTFVAFSVLNEPASIDWTLIGDQKELNIHGSHLGPYCYPAAIESVVSGQIDVDSLISAEYPIDRFSEAMAAAMSGDNRAVSRPRARRGLSAPAQARRRSAR